MNRQTHTTEEITFPTPMAGSNNLRETRSFSSMSKSVLTPVRGTNHNISSNFKISVNEKLDVFSTESHAMS